MPMLRHLIALAALPALVACGDSADESDDPPPSGSDITAGAPAESVAPDSSGAAPPDPAAADSATPTPEATAGEGSAAVPPTNQGAQYQDSVTEPPEAAP